MYIYVYAHTHIHRTYVKIVYEAKELPLRPVVNREPLKDLREDLPLRSRQTDQEAVVKVDTKFDLTCVRNLEQAKSQKQQNGGYQGFGEVKKGGNCFVGTELKFYKMESSGVLFHNTEYT